MVSLFSLPNDRTDSAFTVLAAAAEEGRRPLDKLGLRSTIDPRSLFNDAPSEPGQHPDQQLAVGLLGSGVAASGEHVVTQSMHVVEGSGTGEVALLVLRCELDEDADDEDDAEGDAAKGDIALMGKVLDAGAVKVCLPVVKVSPLFCRVIWNRRCTTSPLSNSRPAKT